MKKIRLDRIEVDDHVFSEIMNSRYPNGDIRFLLASVEDDVFEPSEIREYFRRPMDHSDLLDFWMKNTNLHEELNRLDAISEYFDYSLFVKSIYQRNLESGPFNLLSGLTASYYRGGSYCERPTDYTFLKAGQDALNTISIFLEGNESEYNIEQILGSGIQWDVYFGVMQRERKIFFLQIIDVD